MKIVVFFQTLTTLFMLTISACSNETSEPTGIIEKAPACPTGVAEYIGCWDTPGCQQLSAFPPDIPTRWVIDRVYLTADNEYFTYRKAYDDASCNGNLAFATVGSKHSFTVGGPTTLSNGLMGYELQVDSNTSMSSQDSYKVIVAATMNNTLCLSKNWDVNDEGFKFNFVDGTDIDMTNCLNAAT
jgi:hypothetical protein